jgi:hypothetical protein
LIIIIMLGEEYELWSSSLCRFLHPWLANKILNWLLKFYMRSACSAYYMFVLWILFPMLFVALCHPALRNKCCFFLLLLNNLSETVTLRLCFCEVPRRKNWDSTAGITTGYVLDEWGSISGRGKRFVFTPDRLWRPPSLLSSGYLVLFPRR